MIIWNHIKIGNNTKITGTIIGDNCIITDTAIADNVQINNNITIPQGTKIWPNTHIESSITRPNLEIK